MKCDVERKRIFDALDAIWDDTLRLAPSITDEAVDRVSSNIDEIVHMVMEITSPERGVAND